MNEVYKFKIMIRGLEDKIWREIHIKNTQTIADLAYAILVSFNSLASHLFEFEIGNTRYSCGVDYEEGKEIFEYVKQNNNNEDLAVNIVTEMCNSTEVKLSDIDFVNLPNFEFNYDFGSPTIFDIEYLGSYELEEKQKISVPKVHEGKGFGMIDNIINEDLIEIVEKSEKTKRPEHFVNNIFYDIVLFDNESFDLRGNNLKMEVLFNKIKELYENPQTY